jgi:hypothetical protein
LIDLASLSQIEGQNLHPKAFKDAGPFFDDVIHPFCSFLLNEALTIPDSHASSAVAIISSRIRISHILRRELTLSDSLSHAFAALYSGELSWDSQLIRHLREEIETHSFGNITRVF